MECGNENPERLDGGGTTPDSEELKELKSVKKLLVLIALKNGASLDEIDKATGMGVSHISEMFPKRKKADSAEDRTAPIESIP